MQVEICWIKKRFLTYKELLGTSFLCIDNTLALTSHSNLFGMLLFSPLWVSIELLRSLLHIYSTYWTRRHYYISHTGWLQYLRLLRISLWEVTTCSSTHWKTSPKSDKYLLSFVSTNPSFAGRQVSLAGPVPEDGRISDLSHIHKVLGKNRRKGSVRFLHLKWPFLPQVCTPWYSIRHWNRD